ncbi:MAG: methionyl-tRNA formyltransferase [Candidatus Eremiobacteraeota bacterium]|nr:methionyl-tRNA formyltransferase [Candidatus Eremiobacteraeota bacterium]
MYEPQSLRRFAADAAAQACDLFVVASYGKILPQVLLDLPKLGALNVHPSLLPKYRGATPIQGALLAGDDQTGVTIMLMDAGMDTGDIVLQERTPIGEDETYGELHDRLAQFAALALSHAIDLAASGHIPHTPQRGEPSYTRPLRREDLAIDWHWSTTRIVNAVRAYAPAPAARAVLQGTAVKLLGARAGMPAIGSAKPGDVIGIHGTALCVRASDGVVEIERLVAPNRPTQTGAAFAQSLTA